MRKSKIIEYGRQSLVDGVARKLLELKHGDEDYSLADSMAAYRTAEDLVTEKKSTEDLFLAGKIFLGRGVIRERKFRPGIAGGGFSDSQDTAAALADSAASKATDYEALTAFNKKQVRDRVAMAMGATLAAAVIGGGLWYANRNDAPVDDLPLQSPETTVIPLPNIEDPTSFYSGGGLDSALPPITTSTLVPPATPLY